MDRIDLVCSVWRPDPGVLLTGTAGVSSGVLRERVNAARELAQRRGLGCSSRLTGSALLAACRMHASTSSTFETMAKSQHLSGRGITRLLRVARTFADLDGSDRVRTDDLAEALSFRAITGS